MDYYHVVFTLPEKTRDLAYQNKAVVYNLLFQSVAQTLQTIGGDPKHLSAKIGTTLVLHTWGSAMIHHPHIHGIIPDSTNHDETKNKNDAIDSIESKELTATFICPNCGGALIVIETFTRGQLPRAPPLRLEMV